MASGICSTGKRHTQAGRSCRYRRGALSSGSRPGALAAVASGKDRAGAPVTRHLCPTRSSGPEGLAHRWAPLSQRSSRKTSQTRSGLASLSRVGEGTRGWFWGTGTFALGYQITSISYLLPSFASL